MWVPKSLGRSAVTDKIRLWQSTIASKLIGPDNPVYSFGQSAFRFIIPVEELTAKEEVRDLFDPPGMNSALGSDRKLIWYHCRKHVITLSWFPA
jgi:hypothetical protein